MALRAAALDTGAIEGLYTVDRGFTMTVAVQGLAWAQMIEERGAGVRELFEAQLSGYELVLDAVTRKLPVTEAWIRALHETLCAPQRSHRVLTAAGWQEGAILVLRHRTVPLIQFETQVLVVLETNPQAPFAFHLEEPSDTLDIRLEDVHPEINEALKLRLDGWAERLLAGSLRQLEERSRG